MPFALSGAAGAVSTGAASAAVTPAYGTGANRTLNDLLLLLVLSTGVATLPASITNWTIQQQTAGTSCSASIYYRIATGADAAPTVPVVTSAIHNAALYEFSGNAVTLPSVGSLGSSGTVSPIGLNIPSADPTAGALLVGCGGAIPSSARTNPAMAHTFNNGATATSQNNNGTSTASHYNFAYGFTTSNATADQDSFAFTTTQLTGAVVVIASFKLAPPPGLPVVRSQAVARAATWMQAEQRNWWRPRLWLPPRPAFAGVYLG